MPLAESGSFLSGGEFAELVNMDTVAMHRRGKNGSGSSPANQLTPFTLIYRRAIQFTDIKARVSSFLSLTPIVSLFLKQESLISHMVLTHQLSGLRGSVFLNLCVLNCKVNRGKVTLLTSPNIKGRGLSELFLCAWFLLFELVMLVVSPFLRILKTVWKALE